MYIPSGVHSRLMASTVGWNVRGCHNSAQLERWRALAGTTFCCALEGAQLPSAWCCAHSPMEVHRASVILHSDPLGRKWLGTWRQHASRCLPTACGCAA